MKPNPASLLTDVIHRFYEMNPTLNEDDLRKMALEALDDAHYRIQFAVDDDETWRTI